MSKNTSDKQQHSLKLPDPSNINFKRGSNSTKSELANSDVNYSLEETYETFETVVVQHILPKQQEIQPSIKNNESVEFLSKSSFNDFEYWNTRSISNIDNLLVTDQPDTCNHNLDNQNDDDDDENIYADDDTQIVEYVYEAEIVKKSSKDVATVSSDDLVNAYYARKMGTNSGVPLCDIKSFTQDAQSLSSGTAVTKSSEVQSDEAITHLHCDYVNNALVKGVDLEIEISQKVPGVHHEALSPSSNIITSTRFLQGNASNQLTTPQPETPSISSSFVVSKIKSWLTKPTKIPSPSQQQQTPVTTNQNEAVSVESSQQQKLMFTSSSSNIFKQPLSIDLIRKLKRPNTIPELLEYNKSMTFQGSVLEDWLMQTLDEYLNNSASNACTHSGQATVFTTTIKNLKDTLDRSINKIQSLGSSEDLDNEEIVISQNTMIHNNNLSLTQSNHSLPGTQEITPTTSVTSINTAFPDDTDQVSSSRPKLASDSYKKAVQSYENMESFEVNIPKSNLGVKRQEAKFYVQQILTDLIALGVLEYESGFENAINKTFKPKSEYVWGRFFAIPDISSGGVGGSSQTPGKLTIWPPLLQDSESYSNLDKSYTLDTSRLFIGGFLYKEIIVVF